MVRTLRLLIVGSSFVLFAAIGLRTQVQANDDLAKHFEKKVITVVTPMPAGAAIDLYSRAFALGVAEYLPGRPRSIIVENIPGGGGRRGTVRGMAAKPDGLTVTIIHPRWWLASLFGDPPPGFHHEKVGIIGTPTSKAPYMLCGRRTVAASWKDVLKLGRPLIVGASPPGSSPSIGPLFAQYVGAPVRMVHGYLGPTDAMPAFVRGEIDAMAYCHPGNIGRTFPDVIERGEVAALFWWGMAIPDEDFLKKVGGLPPHLLDVLDISKEQRDAFEIASALLPTRAFVLPPGTPDNIQTAWVQAFTRMIESQAFAKRIVAMGRSEWEITPAFSQDMRKLFEKTRRLQTESPKAYELLKKLLGQ